MAPSVKNRFTELRARIAKNTNREELRKEARGKLQEWSIRFLARVRANAPDGSKWNDPDEVFDKRQKFPMEISPRPSLRQHGMTLDSAWQDPLIDFRGSTGNTIRGSVTIENVSPQIRWLMEGTVPHNIGKIPVSPDTPRLYFWHFLSAETDDEDESVNGVERYPHGISHPGTMPSTFMQKTHRQMRPEIRKIFETMSQDKIEGLFD